MLQLTQVATSGKVRAMRILLQVDGSEVRRKRLHSGCREILFEQRRWLITKSGEADRLQADAFALASRLI